MKALRTFLTAAVLAASGSYALADALPEKGPNGGPLRESGDHHIELVVSGQTLTVHLLDHKNKPSAEAGVTGSAVVTSAAGSETVTLAAQADGVLTGTGKFPATGKLKVDVTLQSPGEAALKATFDVTR